MTKFQMNRCPKASKRSADDTPGAERNIPKAGDIVLDAVIPRTQSTRAAHAPVVVCIYKFTQIAGDVLPDEYADKAVPLYQDRVFYTSPCVGNAFSRGGRGWTGG